MDDTEFARIEENATRLTDEAFAVSQLRSLGLNVVPYEALPAGVAFAVSVARNQDGTQTVHAAKLTGLSG